MEEQLIIILALDNLIKTYREQLTQEDFIFNSEDEKMAFYDIHDGAINLLKKKVEQLPPEEKSQILPNLWINQIFEPMS